MSQKLLRKWLLVGDNGKPVKVSQSQFSKLVVFANWLESDAELQRAADQHEQENACNWDNVSSPDFDGCNGCKFSCALGHFPNRSVGD